MSSDIPQRYEPQIEQIANAQHISTDEALELVIRAGIERLAPTPKRTVSYVSLFGAAKDGYGSREAVDRAIAEMRGEW